MESTIYEGGLKSLYNDVISAVENTFYKWDPSTATPMKVAIVSILLYGCITWTLTKRLEKKLDGNYTRMLRAILNMSWRQHPTKQQLYGHLPSITKLSKLDKPDMQDTTGEVGTN